MKTYIFEVADDLDSLTAIDVPEPDPGPRDVVIRIRATSLNYRDLLIARGVYGPKERVTPLSDGAGEVVAVGEAVTRAKIGDRVAITFFPRWLAGRITADAVSQQPSTSLPGVLTELRAIDEDAIVHLPAHLSFEEAATLPCAALTAWSALTAFRPVIAGETVLTMGSGGVSIFGLQFAKLMGAKVIMTTSGEAKGERLKALGADEIVNYNESPDWHVKVRELTGGRGADHILEIGGPGTIERSLKSAALDAQISLIGVLAEAPAGIDPALLSAGVTTVRRATVGNRADFEAMNRAIAAHGLRPIVDRIFPFEDARAAFQYFDGRNHFGKVVISGA